MAHLNDATHKSSFNAMAAGHQAAINNNGGGGGGLSGAALRRMQELAQSLYDSTPGLQEGNPVVILFLKI